MSQILRRSLLCLAVLLGLRLVTLDWGYQRACWQGSRAAIEYRKNRKPRFHEFLLENLAGLHRLFVWKSGSLSEEEKARLKEAQDLLASLGEPEISRDEYRALLHGGEAIAGELAPYLRCEVWDAYHSVVIRPGKKERRVLWWVSQRKREQEPEDKLDAYRLALAYRFGIGLERDDERAFELYARAAAKHHANACLVMARRELEGSEGEATPEKALVWLGRALENVRSTDAGIEDTEALLEVFAPQAFHMDLAELRARAVEALFVGLETPSTDGDGHAGGEPQREPLLRLERLGHLGASELLGDLARQGSTPGGRNRAEEHYRRAASRGSATAIEKLGALLVQGSSKRRRVEEGRKWLLKAARVGRARAQRLVGYLCLGKKGIDKDLEEARYWLGKAADQGDEKARRWLAKIGQ